MARSLPPEAVRRLAALRVQRFERPGRGLDDIADKTVRKVAARWSHELCGLLNAMTSDELTALARGLRITTMADTKAPALRLALWTKGAELERFGADVSPALQPKPILLGGHLVVMAPPRGLAPPAARYPRALPAEAVATPPLEEPDSLDELLAAADRLIGVRLGPRGRDKGAWGMRAAQLLGLTERGHDEPDWRGDVEVKTVPVDLDDSGLWSIAEDPAIAMVGDGALLGAGAMAKLQRTLWLARATIEGSPSDATIISWYLLDWDAEVGRLARRYLHERPKGPRNTRQRGFYLSRRFFADTGLLATLNGLPA